MFPTALSAIVQSGVAVSGNAIWLVQPSRFLGNSTRASHQAAISSDGIIGAIKQGLEDLRNGETVRPSALVGIIGSLSGRRTMAV